MNFTRFEDYLRWKAKQLRAVFKARANLPDSEPAELERTFPDTEFEAHRLSPVFRIREVPFFGKPSIVRIYRQFGVTNIDAHEHFLDQSKFGTHFIRLNSVLQAYRSGVTRILDHSEAVLGKPMFHLDLSDGFLGRNCKTGPGDALYAFTRRKQHKGVGLVPDPYTLSDISKDSLFAEYPDRNAAEKAYRSRKPLVFWRGTTTGGKAADDLGSNRRIRICMESLRYPGSLDLKISRVCQFHNNHKVLSRLVEAGVMSEPVPEAEFSKFMSTVDLDGNTAAWGTLRKYLRLVHVISLDSEFDMFYSVDQPADTRSMFRDMGEFLQSVKARPGLADNFDAAWNGYRFAREWQRKTRSGNATVFPEDTMQEQD